MAKGLPGFPRSLREFQAAFPNEDACVKYLFRVRWPDGFRCSRCLGDSCWVMKKAVYRCRRCRAEVSLTSGTVMHRTRLPLQHWFWAAHLMSTLTPGISALQLKRQVGLGSYRTALFLCRRLRRAMVNPGRDPLCGVVEVDEAFVGGRRRKEPGGRGVSKAVVIAAVENRGDHTGRIRLKVAHDTSSLSLHAFIRENVAIGSQVNTDAWNGYRGLAKLGYDHRPKVQGPSARSSEILPWVHRVFSNLKTWLRGTHHGRIQPDYLQNYLDEFAFRYNRRRFPEQSFLTLLLLATKRSPLKKKAALQGASSA